MPRTRVATWGTEEDDPDDIGSAKVVESEPPQNLTLTRYHDFAESGPLPSDESPIRTNRVVQPVNSGASVTITQFNIPDEAVATTTIQDV
ncbi:MAG TPA: hypothetical protein DCG12_09515 [Planctomycetaceae bacterium]|nr:hypothetical protein [Planctomycetaceae bacterium]